MTSISKREAVGWARLWAALLKAVLFIPLTDGMAEVAEKISSVQIGGSPDFEGDEGIEVKWWREALKPSENFRRDVAALIGSNTSAVLMFVRKTNVSVTPELFSKYNPTMVHTVIGDEHDKKLGEMLKRR
jgi:hypothetical protein